MATCQIILALSMKCQDMQHLEQSYEIQHYLFTHIHTLSLDMCFSSPVSPHGMLPEKTNEALNEKYIICNVHKQHYCNLTLR